MTEGMNRLRPWKDMLTKIKHIMHAMVYECVSMLRHSLISSPEVSKCKFTIALNDLKTSFHVVFSFRPWVLTT